MGFLLWECNGCCTPNLEEEAHGFNKWQLGLFIKNSLYDLYEFFLYKIRSNLRDGILSTTSGQSAIR